MNITPQSKPGLVEILLRSLMVGVIYAVVNVLIMRSPDPIYLFLISIITGTMLCLSLSPFLLNSNWTRRNTVLAVWAVLALVRSVGLGIEGSLFRPTTAMNSIIGAILGVLVNLLIAWLVVLSLMPVERNMQEGTIPLKSWWGWTWRVLVVGLAYFVFYFVFGATNALLYTKPFYENHPQYGLTLPPTGIIFLAQLIRGPLFGLGSLFIALAVTAPRRRVAVWLGLLLFIVGGAAPYLEVTFRSMPLGFNLATLAEILCQNFLTGVVAANLYKSNQH